MFLIMFINIYLKENGMREIGQMRNFNNYSNNKAVTIVKKQKP